MIKFHSNLLELLHLSYHSTNLPIGYQVLKHRHSEKLHRISLDAFEAQLMYRIASSNLDM